MNSVDVSFKSNTQLAKRLKTFGGVEVTEPPAKAQSSTGDAKRSRPQYWDNSRSDWKSGKYGYDKW